MAIGLLWIGAWGPVLHLPPLLGAIWVLFLLGALLWRYAVRPIRNRDLRHCSVLRLRRVSVPWRTAALAIPAAVAFLVAVDSLTVSESAAREAEDFAQRFISQPGGWVPLLLIAVVFGPIAEEVFFRGWLQRPLEWRLGTIPAVTLSALLFALIHLSPDLLVSCFVAGVLFGAVVVIARSLWAGIGLHAAGNLWYCILYLVPEQHRFVIEGRLLNTEVAVGLILVAGSVLVLVVVQNNRTMHRRPGIGAGATPRPADVPVRRAPHPAWRLGRRNFTRM